jgi:hypothetical protein
MKDKSTAAKKDAPLNPFDTDKNLALRTSVGPARAEYGFLVQFLDSAQHLYLLSGEVYRVGESDLTRIR